MRNYITSETSKGIHKIKWSNLDNLFYVLSKQRKQPFNTANKEIWITNIEDVMGTKFTDFANKSGWGLYSDLPNDAKILDVGAGNSIFDLFAAQYLPESTFYLVDKNEFNLKNFKWFSDNHQFYNQWEVVIDAIESSNLDKNRFHMLEPTDEWPENIDLVTSFQSWGLHYPLIEKYEYWERVQRCLKPGGIFYLEISNATLQHDVNTITRINKVLGEPKQVRHVFPPDRSLGKVFNATDDGSLGQLIKWVKPDIC